MGIYFIIFLLLFVASMLEAGGLQKRQAGWVFIGLSIMITLFVGLRYHTGADWLLYKETFNGVSNSGMEYGYLLLNKIFKAVFDNYYVLQFSATLFFIFAICRFYQKEAPYPIAALVLIVSFLLFNILMAQVRQSLAIAIILLFSNYIFERKFWYFLLGIFIASFFHASAIVAIPLYFLYKNYGKTLQIALILVANIFYFYPELLKIIVVQVAPILPDIISVKAINYMETIFAEKMKFNTGLGYLSQSAIILVVILFAKIKDNKSAFFINTLTVFAIVKALTISVAILERIESYYLVYAVIALTYIWDIKIKNVQLYCTRLIFAGTLILYFYVSPLRALVSKEINPITNRPENYTKVPYYNVLSHPPEASTRKDWIEK